MCIPVHSTTCSRLPRVWNEITRDLVCFPYGIYWVKIWNNMIRREEISTASMSNVVQSFGDFRCHTLRNAKLKRCLFIVFY